ncbi:hypothetical protein PILCRDRAFT_87907 [Piloderma croceum F 1598]|uniref:Uncharacterized protein n=1 Tax=Piloderma croceum (strain F 1598) TaxID=765440 RepID=A0A0C3FHV8_PILCF|nr:hypothetical protein PILCRDRAFT_87907 [Piloderma croceum F 1598]
MIACAGSFICLVTFSRGALLLLLSASSLAYYIIDDTDSSITYTGRFNHLSGNFVLNTSFPNGTIGSVTAHVGTGITVFVAQAYAPLNASITLDGGTPAPLTLSQPTNVMYHVPFYASQALPLIQHVLEIRLNSWDGKSALSHIFLDYVGVAYDDNVPTPSPVAAGTTTSSSHKSTGALVGGVAGGAVMGLIVVGGLVVFLRGRNVDARYSHFTTRLPISLPIVDPAKDLVIHHLNGT